METVKARRSNENQYSIEQAMNVIFSKPDDAIDDLESGRVLTEEEVWKEFPLLFSFSQ